MNPPSIILGGGVHGKTCWLIAYKYNNNNTANSSAAQLKPCSEQLCILLSMFYISCYNTSSPLPLHPVLYMYGQQIQQSIIVFY